MQSNNTTKIKKDMFTKEERLFIWKKVYEMIDRLEDGEYICVALHFVQTKW